MWIANLCVCDCDKERKSLCVCLCVREKEKNSLCVRVSKLTGIQLAVLSQFFGLLVKFISGVEASVSVEVDAGGEVHHEHREGGDLVHDKLVFL